MKRRVFRNRIEIAKRLMVGYCISALMPVGYPNPVLAGGTAATPPAKPNLLVPAVNGDPPVAIKVNRTIPRVEPPKTALKFSANPTSDDLFRARVFEEPLV